MKGNDIVIENASEKESLRLIEIWGDTWQDNYYSKNLFDKNNINLLGNEVSCTIENNTIKFEHPTSHNQIKLRFKLDRNLDTSKKYVLSGSNIRVFVQGEWTTEGITTAMTNVLEGNIFETSFIKNWKPITKLEITNLQIEEGNVATSYEPYYKADLSNIQHVGELYVNSRGRSILNREGNEQYKIEIKSHNENLFDGELINGWYTTNTGVYAYAAKGNVCNKNKIQVSPNIKIYSNKVGLMRICEYDKNNKLLKTSVDNGNGVTLSNNTKYINIYYNNNGNTDDTVIISYKKPKSYIPHKSDKTTILLPCQLMKVGDVADKLYWDEKNNKYIVEKNIKKFHINDLNIKNNPNIGNNNASLNLLSKKNIGLNNVKNGFGVSICSSLKEKRYYGDGDRESASFQYSYSNDAGSDWICIILPKEFDSNIKFIDELKRLDTYFIFQLNKSQLIETTILEQKTLNCYNNRTYVTINNTNLSPVMKISYPININTSNQIFLPRENNFDSILNVTLEPNKNTNITFLEGGLDLKLTSGIEILSKGEDKISNKNECYASKDFINLASYTSSTFTIDTMDIPFEINNNKFTIYYYDKDQQFIEKESVPFGNKCYKSNIQYPSNTQYCKIAFVNKPDIKSDYYKIRILRDKTKENGFKTIEKTFKNTDGYIKSFSEYLPIKDNIERLIFFTDNYDSINEFSIINNLDNNKKKHTCKIPRILGPGETLSYNRSRNKQFVYNSNSTPYNKVTNIDYNDPNIAKNIGFILDRKIDIYGGNIDAPNSGYSAVEEFIDVSNYQNQKITFSAALPVTNVTVYCYRKDQTYLAQTYSNAKNFVTLTVPSNCHYIKAVCYLVNLASQSDETKELIQKHVMITATDYRCD